MSKDQEATLIGIGKTSHWLMTLAATVMIGFCTFYLKDIYSDFKAMRAKVEALDKNDGLQDERIKNLTELITRK